MPRETLPIQPGDWETVSQYLGLLSNLYLDVFNVKAQYGAVGDNVADDTARIQAAITAAQATSQGGIVFFPSGMYRCTSTLLFQGNAPVFMVGVTMPDSTSTLRRDFSGDFLQLERSVSMRNMLLYDSSTSAGRTGAAIKMNLVKSGSTLTRRAQYCVFENVRVTSDDPAGAWERIVYADGNTYTGVGGAGIRDIAFINCFIFGARTAGETIRVDLGTNWTFLGGHFADGAPTVIAQGIQINNVASDTFHFAGCHIGGSIVSDANHLTVTGGDIAGNVTLTALASNSNIDSTINGTISNLAAAGNNNAIVDVRRRVGEIAFYASVASNPAFSARVVGDTGDRLLVRGDGLLYGGNGAGSFWKYLQPQANGWATDGGVGQWGHAPPAAQPARAVTLADVIAVLAGNGSTA